METDTADEKVVTHKVKQTLDFDVPIRNIDDNGPAFDTLALAEAQREATLGDNASQPVTVISFAAGVSRETGDNVKISELAARSFGSFGAGDRAVTISFREKEGGEPANIFLQGEGARSFVFVYEDANTQNNVFLDALLQGGGLRHRQPPFGDGARHVARGWIRRSSSR